MKIFSQNYLDLLSFTSFKYSSTLLRYQISIL